MNVSLQAFYNRKINRLEIDVDLCFTLCESDQLFNGLAGIHVQHHLLCPVYHLSPYTWTKCMYPNIGIPCVNTCKRSFLHEFSMIEPFPRNDGTRFSGPGVNDVPEGLPIEKILQSLKVFGWFNINTKANNCRGPLTIAIVKWTCHVDLASKLNILSSFIFLKRAFQCPSKFVKSLLDSENSQCMPWTSRHLLKTINLVGHYLGLRVEGSMVTKEAPSHSIREKQTLWVSWSESVIFFRNGIKCDLMEILSEVTQHREKDAHQKQTHSRAHLNPSCFSFSDQKLKSSVCPNCQYCLQIKYSFSEDPALAFVWPQWVSCSV